MKVKCDDQRPCGRCVKLKRVHLCVDRIRKRKRRELASHLGVSEEFDPAEAMKRIQPAMLASPAAATAIAANATTTATPVNPALSAFAGMGTVEQALAALYGITDPSALLSNPAGLAALAKQEHVPVASQPQQVPFQAFDAGQVVPTAHFEAPLLPQELRMYLITAYERYPMNMLRALFTAHDSRM